jgi:hypothetical protein
MRNLLANIANAWVRGTLHALNSVLFAKYLSLAWGFNSATAATVSGVFAGVWLARARLCSILLSVWHLRADSYGCDLCPDAPAQATGLAKNRSGCEPR